MLIRTYKNKKTTKILLDKLCYTRCLLLLLGLFTRPVAFILSGMMAVAYFIGHVAEGGNIAVPFLNGGEAAALFSFIFLYFSVAGGGKWALDNKRNAA